MPAIRTAAIPVRAAIAALAAALIALRVLSPAGFMPAFDRGAVTIVACPDSGPLPMPSSHHHDAGKRSSVHQSCPYAAAAALGGIDAPTPLVLALPLFAVAFLPGRAFALVQRHAQRDRPPSRGPPFPT